MLGLTMCLNQRRQSGRDGVNKTYLGRRMTKTHDTAEQPSATGFGAAMSNAHAHPLASSLVALPSPFE